QAEAGIRAFHVTGVQTCALPIDAHAVDHADDVLDLLRIDQVVGQVVVDFGVGQVALLQPLGNQELDVGLLSWTFVRHEARTGEESEPVIIPVPAVRILTAGPRHGPPRPGREPYGGVRRGTQAPAARGPEQARSRKVTGPSLASRTTMWAPKRPVATGPAWRDRHSATSAAKTGSAASGAAAVLKPGRMPELVSAARVNWLTSSRPPPVSARARFIRPWSSAKTR